MGRPPDASAQPTIPDQPPAVVPPAAAPTWSMGQPPIYTWQTGLLIDTQRPAALGLFPHALADVARLPVREVVSALHFKADLTLGLGTVAFDYLAK